jgi:predicted alpha/beta-fold hydrolase
MDSTSPPTPAIDAAADAVWEPPAFRPSRWLRGGHAQTLGGFYLPGKQYPYRATQHRVDLPDGDAIILHDDCPDGWRDDDPAVLLIHGLAGSHASPYMNRIAGRLNDIGVRTFRMDLRGCGAGAKLARLPYHAGRSDDALSAVIRIAELAPRAPLAIVGFSLGGNITLKLLGQRTADVPATVAGAVAVNPAIALAECIAHLDQPLNRLYDRYFVRLLLTHLAQREAGVPEQLLGRKKSPRGLFDFDDRFTAPVSGFRDAADYYAQSSATQFLVKVAVPTLILASRDDPLIPFSTFLQAERPATVQLHLADSGGHLGFVGRAGMDPDRRWMDWRILEWVRRHLGPLSPRE